MKGNDPLSFKFLMGFGLFSIICAALDLEFFMGSRKAAFFVKHFGRNGARIIYGILGLILLLGGIRGLGLF